MPGSKQRKVYKQNSRSKDNVKPRSSLFSFFRGSIGLGILVLLLLFLGSKLIHEKLLDLIHKRNIASSSMVLGRAIEITPGSNIKALRILTRLERLGYQRIKDTPEHPGQFADNGDTVFLFLREVVLTSGNRQPEALYSLSIKDGLVTDIKNAKFNATIPTVIIEPETLSLIGDKSSRAVTYRTLPEFPQHLIQAVLAIEDERFYSHIGVDPIGIARAIFVNLIHGGLRQGGSTLTQQLAKNVFFSQERSLVRKVAEASTALMIEMAFTKDQILEFYLNEVFLGQEGLVAIHGFGEAAQSFYGKDVKDISVAEAATLAGIIKAPTTYSPRFHPENAQRRREVVLQKMHDLGFLTDAQYTAATKQIIKIIVAQRINRQAPYFVDYLRKELASVLDEHAFEQKIIRIHTGIDPEYQRCAQAAVTVGLEKLEKQFPKLRKQSGKLQAALISVATSDLQARAWVGGRDYGQNQFCRVSMAKRQPGSSFKPFVYLTALDKSLNHYRVARTTNILIDEPVSIHIPGVGTWEPKNFDEQYRGEVTVREALTYSLNIPTVELAQKVGVDSIAHTAELFGFGENLPHVPSLALGAGEVTPLELSRAYLAIANGGLLSNVISTISVTDDDSDTPLVSYQPKENRVASEPAVYVLTNMMQSVMENGTGRGIRDLGFRRPAAGKTGTSNDARDAWFAGFTPSLLTIVWVGMDDNSQLGLTGGKAAAPIWAEYMKCTAPMEQELDFVPPEGVVFKKVDSKTGLLWDSGCDGQPVTEVFVEGTEPVTICSEAQPEAVSPPAPTQETLSPRAKPLEEESETIPRPRQKAPLRNLGDTEELPPARTRRSSSIWDKLWMDN